MTMKGSGFFKQQPSMNRGTGCETNRTNFQSTSLLNLNGLMSTQAYMSTQSDSFNQTANLSQIKTDLKDKIQSTRERFNQLKQRKRQQISTDAAQVPTTQTLTPSEMGFAISQGTHRGLYQTYRGQGQRSQTQESTQVMMNSREDSLGSDIIDRDEEQLPMALGQGTKDSILRQSRRVLKGSFKSNLPSYKLDGAKLLVNRLQAQFKLRFNWMLESCQESSSPDVKNQLKEKWKFVRNAMGNIDKQKKNPLQDRTGAYLNQQRESQNFVQIQQMFENFKSLRSSSQEGFRNKVKQLEHQMSEGAIVNQQENQIPSTLLQVQRLTKRLSKNTKEDKRKGKSQLQRKGELPPHYAVRKQETKQQQDDILEIGSFATTYRETEFSGQQNQSQGQLPSNMLTARSNIVLDEEYQEGLQQLPLESPMTNDKFIQGRMQIIRDQLTKHDQRRLSSQSQQSDHQTSGVAKILTRMVQIFTILTLRDNFDLLKKRWRIQKTLKKVVLRQTFEEKIQQRPLLKKAFVRMIKNCIFKNKFERFIERAHQRLLEKSFDKIKENNWIIEERKEILEGIIFKNYLTQAFKKLRLNSSYIKSFNNLEYLYQKQLAQLMKSKFLTRWSEHSKQMKTGQQRQDCLQNVCYSQLFKRQGFNQFKSICQRLTQQRKVLLQLVNTKQNKKQGKVFDQWKKFTLAESKTSQREEILANLIHQATLIRVNRSFAKWKNILQEEKIAKFTKIQSALHLILKPILRNKERKQKTIGFAKFKNRVVQMRIVRKQVKCLILNLQQRQRLQISKAYNQWKQVEAPKVLRMSCIEAEVASQLRHSTYESQSELDESQLSLTKDMIESQRIHERIGSKPQKHKEGEDNVEDEEDFENLNQIDRISHDENSMAQLLKDQQQIEVDVKSKIPTLSLGMRTQSQVYGKKGKSGQNLRYM